MPALGSCPCGRPIPYRECCGRLHAGELAPTAESLMRSRYSAFVLRDAGYLLRTWDPTTRPARLRFDPGQVWHGLRVLGSTGGGLLDTTGTVTFRAAYEVGGEPGSIREQGRFARRDGAWVYLGPVAD